MATMMQNPRVRPIGGDMEYREDTFEMESRSEYRDEARGFEGSISFSAFSKMTEPDSKPDHGGVAIGGALKSTVNIIDVIPTEKVLKSTVGAAREVGGDVKSLFFEDIFGVGQKSEKSGADHKGGKPDKNAENKMKIEQNKMRIKEWQMAYQQEVSQSKISEQQKLQQLLMRSEVTMADVVGTQDKGNNVSNENAVSVYSIFLAVNRKAKAMAQAVKKSIPAPRGKAKPGTSLTTNNSAQEGQSQTANAIASAG
jgi:hypothetical protein